MFRKDSIAVKEWLETSNKALLVTGARQIGKTWLIRDEIDKSGYKRFEINFINQPDMVEYLNAEMSAEDFLVKLRLIMCQTAHCGRYIPHFDFSAKPSPIVPYRHLPQSLSGMTADCRSLV